MNNAEITATSVLAIKSHMDTDEEMEFNPSAAR